MKSGDTRKNEISRQLTRINHLVKETGEQPTVLDVTREEFEAMQAELSGLRRYDMPPALLPSHFLNCLVSNL